MRAWISFSCSMLSGARILLVAGSSSHVSIDPCQFCHGWLILDAAQGRARNVFQFAFYKGMRPSEYIALRWESIDWAGFNVRVDVALDGGQGDCMKD
ncbi:hypothetical protein [Janthinobacterium sp. DSP2-3-3]|uniref:hypothetical protein n=1 Tax=Janthinobacterium sp. DSP2-3-3 TaxID=2804596 RepID=UPI003CF5CBA7